MKSFEDFGFIWRVTKARSKEALVIVNLGRTENINQG